MTFISGCYWGRGGGCRFNAHCRDQLWWWRVWGWTPINPTRIMQDTPMYTSIDLIQNPPRQVTENMKLKLYMPKLHLCLSFIGGSIAPTFLCGRSTHLVVMHKAYQNRENYSDDIVCWYCFIESSVCHTRQRTFSVNNHSYSVGIFLSPSLSDHSNDWLKVVIYCRNLCTYKINVHINRNRYLHHFQSFISCSHSMFHALPHQPFTHSHSHSYHSFL